MQLVFTLVEQLDGQIEISSLPGAGTLFELILKDVTVPVNDYAHL